MLPWVKWALRAIWSGTLLVHGGLREAFQLFKLTSFHILWILLSKNLKPTWNLQVSLVFKLSHPTEHPSSHRSRSGFPAQSRLKPHNYIPKGDLGPASITMGTPMPMRCSASIGVTMLIPLFSSPIPTPQACPLQTGVSWSTNQAYQCACALPCSALAPTNPLLAAY